MTGPKTLDYSQLNLPTPGCRVLPMKPIKYMQTLAERFIKTIGDMTDLEMFIGCKSMSHEQQPFLPMYKFAYYLT